MEKITLKQIEEEEKILIRKINNINILLKSYKMNKYGNLRGISKSERKIFREN